jgi:hypothetical protein
VLDALLKLRQVWCDPRLVKLAAMREALSGSRGEAEMLAAPVVTSGKLATLIQMLRGLASEGRRVLVFSQFTSMLDLIKPVSTPPPVTGDSMRIGIEAAPLGGLLVSRIVTGNGGERALTGIR